MKVTFTEKGKAHFESAAYQEELDRYNEIVERVSKEGCCLNAFVMENTQRLCKELPELSEAIYDSIRHQYVVYDNDDDCLGKGEDGPSRNIVFSRKRSFEAACAYKEKKVAVLNFANALFVGGNPWRANAQEEALCRTSTLYPCLKARFEDYHLLHQRMERFGYFGRSGNDDLIYTPDVVVFKTDTLAPHLLPKKEWYKVDVITCAAPFLQGDCRVDPEVFEKIMGRRIRRILQAAKQEGVEVLILGAFGCGAFNNPPFLVAKLFKDALQRYSFETVEFAIYDGEVPGGNYEIFDGTFYTGDK